MVSSCVHVMPKEKFTRGFVEFTESAFPELNCLFVLYGPDDFQGYIPVLSENVVSVTSAFDVFRDSNARKAIKSASLVVLNWVNMNILPFFYPYLKKTVLMFWGGDFGPYCQHSSRGFGLFAKRLLLAHAIKEANGLVVLAKDDLARIETISARHNECFLGMVTEKTRSVFSGGPSCFSKKRRDGSPIRILLGNSATESNRHEEMLRILSGFRNEDILVYAPLSYGDEACRIRVLEMGKALLEDKFIPLTEFIDHDEYMSFLDTIDIGLFNYNRQQGLGTIRPLLARGCKVYLSRESGMWFDFVEQGACLHDIRELYGLSFASFSTIEEDESLVNAKAFSDGSEYEAARALWEKIYSSLGVL